MSATLNEHVKEAIRALLTAQHKSLSTNDTDTKGTDEALAALTKLGAFLVHSVTQGKAPTVLSSSSSSSKDTPRATDTKGKDEGFAALTKLRDVLLDFVSSSSSSSKDTLRPSLATASGTRTSNSTTTNAYEKLAKSLESLVYCNSAISRLHQEKAAILTRISSLRITHDKTKTDADKQNQAYLSAAKYASLDTFYNLIREHRQETEKLASALKYAITEAEEMVKAAETQITMLTEDELNHIRPLFHEARAAVLQVLEERLQLLKAGDYVWHFRSTGQSVRINRRRILRISAPANVTADQNRTVMLEPKDNIPEETLIFSGSYAGIYDLASGQHRCGPEEVAFLPDISDLVGQDVQLNVMKAFNLNKAFLIAD